jgi:Ser/Thr protein kinase RdoA (MazF antagonist)
LLEKAQGKTVDIRNPKEFNEALFNSLGALMGNMHRLTVDYEGNLRQPEFEWKSPTYSWRHDIVILDEEVRLSDKRYFDEICALPVDKYNYGIIHHDIHTDNFFLENGKIKLFDFYDCQINWYAADIASALFFMVQKGAGPLTYKSEKERTQFAESCLIAYLTGYLQTNQTSEYWIKKIDLFMKYQMSDEYLFAQNWWPDELAHLRNWYLDWHKERITNDLPYVFIDYEKVINSIPAVRPM